MSYNTHHTVLNLFVLTDVFTELRFPVESSPWSQIEFVLPDKFFKKLVNLIIDVIKAFYLLRFTFALKSLTPFH